MALEVADVDQSAQGLIEQESKDRRRRLFGFDKQASIQASSGLVIGFIALYSSYDHVQFFNSSIKINQQWGVWLIAASLALVFIDAQLAARSRLRTTLESGRRSNCEISKNLPGQDLVAFTVPRHRERCHAVQRRTQPACSSSLIRSVRFKPQQAHRPCEFLAGLLWRISDRDPTTGP